jgi:hypothetical protein
VRARTPFRPLVSARVKASVRAFVRPSVRPCVRPSEDPSVHAMLCDAHLQ